MKCLILSLTLLNITYIYCDSGIWTALSNKLALDVLLREAGDNVVVSPIALRFPLCKLALYAEGETKKELTSILGLTNQTMIRNCYAEVRDVLRLYKEVELILLNKLYLNTSTDVKDVFTKNSGDIFGVEVDRVNFSNPNEALKQVNDWIGDSTYHRISGFLKDHDIDDITSMLHISAIHCKTTWEFSFDVRNTKHMNFRSIDQVASIPMMTKTEETLFYFDKVTGMDYITIKLGTWGTTMTFVVPQTAENLKTFLFKLYSEPKHIRDIRSKMIWKVVTLTIPKFHIKSTIDWTEFLKRIGFKRIFNSSNEDFSKIIQKNSKLKRVYLSKAKQRNFIEVDEMGSFRNRAAYTMSQPERSPNIPGMNQIREVLADRPFYFTVDLAPTPAVSYELLHGMYYGPKADLNL